MGEDGAASVAATCQARRSAEALHLMRCTHLTSVPPTVLRCSYNVTSIGVVTNDPGMPLQLEVRWLQCPPAGALPGAPQIRRGITPGAQAAAALSGSSLTDHSHCAALPAGVLQVPQRPAGTVQRQHAQGQPALAGWRHGRRP